MKSHITISIVFMLFMASGLFAQSGPAGIGNATGTNGQPENIYWLDASELTLSNNDAVSSWNDKSGNVNNVTQTGTARPTFKDASDPNYTISAVSFDGADDFFDIDGSLLVGTDYTILLVGTRKSGGREVIMGGSTGSSNQNLHPYFNTNRLHSHQYGNDHNGNYTGGDGSVANATTPDFGVFGFRLNASLASDNRVIYQNGSVISTRTNSAQLSSFIDAALARYEQSNEFSDLELAELIIYADALNDAQITIVQNYLASKYGITMDANDFYAGDETANGDFDFNVAGIGRLNGQTLTANNTEGLYLTADASLDADGEFLMAGDDNTSNAVSTANLASGIEARWNKSWYIDKTGTLSAKVAFDFQEGIGGLYPAGNKDNYVLLRENAGTFDIVPITDANKAIVGSSVEFTISDAELVDGVYTIGTINQSDSPLVGEPNQTWYSRLSGDWNDPSIWTLDGGATPVPDNPANEIPDPTDNVVINNGTTVTMVNDNRTVASAEILGTLNVGTSIGHDFTTISGDGLIRVAGNGGNGNFPAGDTQDFADDFTGGTVEYYGAGLSITERRTFNNVVVNMATSTTDLIILNDLEINGDLQILNGDFQINDNSSTTIKTIEIDGDLFVDNNGSISVGTANTIGSFSIAANNMPSSGNYHNIYHQLILGGDFTNQGNVRFTNQTAPVYNEFTTNGAVTVRFVNAADANINLFGTTDFYNLIVDKGIDETFMLNVTANNSANFALYGPNNVGRNSGGGFSAANPEVRKALWIYHGTLHLTGRISIPTLSEGNRNGGNGDYPIGATGALWIDGNEVSVYSTADNTTQIPSGATGINTGGSNQALSLYGKFRITNGVFGTRGSAGFIFWNVDAGEVLIEGGTVNVSQFRSAGGGGGIYSYTQSGGDVLVRANEGVPGESNGSYSLFSLDTRDAVFNMSGGSITVYGNRTETVFINSAEGNYSVTGGTFRVENRNGNEAIISSTVPFWNLELGKGDTGDADEINLTSSTSGGNTILDPNLVVLNNFTIESGIIFDHNGNDVTIGSDFTIENGANYVSPFDYTGSERTARQNTTTFNGTDDATLSFFNRTGGTGDEQRFWNLIVDRPAGKKLSLRSGKTNLNNNNNNLLRIDGDFFKVLSGTVDQGNHSIRMYADTLLNYDNLTLFDDTDPGDDSNLNSDNDLLKLRPENFVLITADTSEFGNLRLNSGNRIVTLRSDLKITRLEHRHGRLNLGVHNLTIDFLDVNLNGSQTRTDEDGGGNFSVEDMFIVAGNASDGGLSLKVNADGTNPGFIDMSGAANSTSNPTVFFFPLGTGTTGNDADSEFTPANIRLASATSEGYITVKVVTEKLATAGPYPLGNDVSDRYWIVDYRDFSTVPKVERMWFRSVERDDPNAGTGFPSNFVPGYVLEDSPFSRTDEVNGDNNNTSFIENNDAQDLRIYFWGNEGPATDASGNPAGGFDLINASYTAGDASKFVGSPQIFYSINTAPTNWTNTNAWSLFRDGTPAGDYPRAGDVAILTRDNGGGGDPTSYGAGVFTINNGTGPIEIAKLIFDDYDPTNDNWISGCPRVIFDAGGSYTAYNSVFSSVEVTDRHIGGPVPNQSHGAVIEYRLNSSYTGNFPGGDFGDFNRYENALVIYAWDGGTGTAVLSADATEYPMLWFQGGNLSNRIIQFPDVDVTVNGRANINGNMIIRPNNQSSRTLTFKNNVQIGSGCCGEGIFEFDGNSVENQTVIIEGNLNFNTGNGGIIRLFNNSANNTHTFIAKGDISVPTTGTINFGNGSNSVVNLELQGNTSNVFSNTGNVTLHRIIMNKGENQSNSFSFSDNFVLTGTSNTAEKAIEILNGTLRLNDAAIDVDLTTGGPDFSIPATGALDIIEGTANVSGDDSGILLDGGLFINGGTLDMSSGSGNGNNYIEYSASGSAQLSITDGSLLVGSQIRGGLLTSAGVLKYSQTGGIVEVGINAAPEGDKGVFDILNTGSEFTYTGGTLTVRRQNSASPSVAAIRILPTTYNITRDIIIDAAVTGQNALGINANVPLAGLTINGTNTPTVITQVNALELAADLTINSGASFDANGIDLILQADMVNDGVFNANSNQTFFSSTTAQAIRGTNPVTFFDFSKNQEGTLDVLDNDVLVEGLFQHLDGILNDNGFTIELKSNAVIDAEHNSSSGDGLLFSGSGAQQLRRSGTGNTSLGVITISNTSGVIIPESNGYDFTIEGNLQMNGGVFNIGSSSVRIGQNADITTNSSFSVLNMVRTNSSFTDNGLSKVFSPGTSSNFLFPIGETSYTPVEIDFASASGNSGSTVGYIEIRPANEVHPTVNNGTDFYGTGDVNNVLQYYWTMNSEGLTNFSADVKFTYDESDVLTAESTVSEADYIAARILAFNNTMNDINKYTISEVNEATNTINFTSGLAFNNVSSNGISGDYFAGDEDAIPNNVATYTTQSVLGDVTNTTTYIEDLPTDGVAPSGSVLIVSTGTELTMNVDNVRLYKTIIEDGAILNINDTDGHRLGILEGTGTLKITSNTINAPLPAFSGDFFGCSGGVLEYDGTGNYNILNGINTLRQLTLNGSGVKTFPNNDIRVCENFNINDGIVNLPNDRLLQVEGNLIMNGGSFNTAAFNGTVSIDGNMQLDGGNFIAGNTGNTSVHGNVIIDGGNLNLGSGTYTFSTYSNLELVSGSFDAGSNNTQLQLVSNGITNNENRITGNFTGTNAFGNILVDKNNGGNNVVIVDAVDITGDVILTDGLVLNQQDANLGGSATVSPAAGTATSYFTGNVTKVIANSGDGFTFPIGSLNRWRPAYVNDVSSGGLTWEAQFIEGDVLNEPLVDNMNATNSADIATIQQGEYWIISDGPASGVTANVGASWGAETDVSALNSERQELQIMAWNDATSSWDNYGGGNFSSGNTENQGQLESTAALTFSTNIVALGSGTAANPLPVEYTYFKAENESYKVVLKWETATEIENDYFEVQRSNDGVTFETIGLVEGHGDSKVAIQYVFDDYSPLVGDSYYRLKQVDYDYDFEFSEVVKVSRKADTKLSIVPNPATTRNVNLKLAGFNQNEEVQVIIFDVSGNVYYKETHTMDDLLYNALPLRADMPSGVYIVKVSQGSLTKNVRLMIY